MNNVNCVEKICSFYVNDWHLTVMLLPYIKKEVEKNSQIITFLEENLEENIFSLISRLNFEEEINKRIKEINWKSNKVLKYTDITKSIKKGKNTTTILISGKREYIERVNKSLEKYIKNNEKLNIKIINCYEVSGFNKNIKDVLNEHDKILNTAGEKNIEDVFEDYKGKSVNLPTG